MQFRGSSELNFGSSLASHLHWWHNQRSILSWHSYCLYADDILLYRTISSNLDYSYLQSDANTIQDWVNCNHVSQPFQMQIHANSCKWNRMNNLITINDQTLETVPTFKYLGSHLTCLGQNILREYAPKQKKKKFGPVLTVNFTSTLTTRLFSNYIHPLSGPTWSMQHQSGTHTWDKIRIYLKALRNLHVKW